MWSCSGIESYNAEAVVVVSSIVSLLASTARKIQILENMQLCSVLDELDKLPTDPEDRLGEDTGDEREQEEQEGRRVLLQESQVTCSGNRKGRSLDAKYKEVWEDRKLLLAVTFFPMSHEETTTIMHCATQTRDKHKAGSVARLPQCTARQGQWMSATRRVHQ